MSNDHEMSAPPRGTTPDDVQSSRPGEPSDGRETRDMPAVTALPPDRQGQRDACEACRSTGLAILPVRYTVVPVWCTTAGLGPLPSGRGCDAYIAGGIYQYALRTMRKGMFYLYYEQSGPYGGNYWEAYAVAENGTLWPQASATAARALVGGGLPSCSRKGHNHLRKEFITIQRPETCGTVWLAYAEHVWTPATLDRYARDATLRAKRMQSIRPAQWLKASEPGEDHAPIGDVSVFDSIMEYQDREGTGREPAELPHFRPPPTLTNADGTFSDTALAAHGTRYPWSMRGARSGGGKGDPWQARYELLCDASSDGRRGDELKRYTPMLLGMWDAVGIVHELNGYCHDIIGGIERYKEERAFEINAADHIDQISTLLQLNAAVMAENYEKTSRAIMEGEDEATNREYARLGMMNGSRPKEKQREKLAEHVEKVLLPAYKKRARDQWENKYWPLIDAPRLDKFKVQMHAVVDKALEHLRPRTKSLQAWLESDLFLSTLEDYDGTSPTCGVQFEEVITDAVEGLGFSIEGRAILAKMAADLKPTEQGCLLWRVVAQNQDDARRELESLLSKASGAKDTSMSTGGAGWAAFATGMDYLKKYLGYYKQFEATQRQVTPTTAANRLLRDSGVDRFVTTAGAAMLNSFPLNGIQDKVGNALVRFVFYTRALMSAEEASDLITREASSGMEAKRYFLDRVAHHRTAKRTSVAPMMYALRDLEQHHGTALMRDCWKRASDSSRNAVRLSSLTGVPEVVNFANLASKADKETRDYANLLASGMALVAVYTSVHETVSKELFGSASRSFGNMKAVGGFLGGASSFIGAYYDMGVVGRELGRENYARMMTIGLKGVATWTVGGAQFLTALAYSAPTIQRVIGKNSITLLMSGLRSGLIAAAAGEGEAVVASEVMKRVGLWVLRLGGWEVALIIGAVQILIWAISPSALEEWCERNAFGRCSVGRLGGFGATSPKFKSIKEQDAAFVLSMGTVMHRAPLRDGL